jgi:hypothetical protein
MRRLMFTPTALLLGCNTCLAQISTIGSTAMGIPSTPGAIVTSALNGPSPFSATTQPGAADTTLAPMPLASDPTTPGTVVTCSAPSGQIMGGATALGTLASSIVVGSATGTLSPVSPLGSPSTTVCSSTPGGPPTNGAALPLSIPEIPSSPPPGTIQPVVVQLGDTSLDPIVAVVPTPNSATCRESVSMSLGNPAMMAPANATGATATPGVLSSWPSGC